MMNFFLGTVVADLAFERHIKCGLIISPSTAFNRSDRVAEKKQQQSMMGGSYTTARDENRSFLL